MRVIVYKRTVGEMQWTFQRKLFVKHMVGTHQPLQYLRLLSQQRNMWRHKEMSRLWLLKVIFATVKPFTTVTAIMECGYMMMISQRVCNLFRKSGKIREDSILSQMK
ncbi:hypothetical protein DPEC_G00163080 [Dallia pectoralis]|uniref:Uncharacterized protein n=1 Tax=Dallia pectoralis TaxID=75939 RepID=A0ACC2GGI4_DALPE|nr:hypothetical protein DPEC_G00163080 [Dallia pectoralis]